MICPNCNNNLPDNSQFCNRCGFNFIQYQQRQNSAYIQPNYNNQYQQQNYTQQPQPVSQQETPKSNPLKSIGCVTYAAIIFFALLIFICAKESTSANLIGMLIVIEIAIILYAVYEVSQNKGENGYQGTANLQRSTPTLSCRRCGGTNINISINTYEAVSRGQAQMKKKSAVRRAGTSMGRGMANIATGGMYGLFSKKPSKYVEVSKNKTKMRQQKIAICQDCGNSWTVF